MSFAIHESNIILCSRDNSVVAYNLESKTQKTFTLPNLATEKEIRAHNNEDFDSLDALLSVVFSADGKYFLICANRKQLCVYNSTSLELVSNRTLARSASRVKFLPNNDIVVADRSGDAYLYSVEKADEKGQLLLGHLSMLLDVLVTSDLNHIITADRDEKIRVSLFPNSYNILSYCLGHKKFVTNLGFVPHDESILVSCGGDGSLMFWDFVKGTELLTIYFHEKFSQNDLETLNEFLEITDAKGKVSVPPVKLFQLIQFAKEKSIICMAFYCSKTILVYSITGLKNDFTVEYSQSIIFNKMILDCKSYGNKLWVLTSDGLHVYKFLESGLILINDRDTESETSDLDELWKKLQAASSIPFLPILYKRTFDSLQEYQERKKLRLDP
ncbi:hypothetical protein QAD02_000598 [Eretmocerus hayati]|uniref:Uncharacterized protein n=1 Tax=Eretmocerus hayati TaxID=131215 RepID=A0ACC2NDQ4_9HYME|nr:hypothetical protein QAD02_000598 [Eretmocerus hayati]